MAIEPITAILEIGGKVIDRLWPDPLQRDAAKLELFKLQQQGAFKESEQMFEIAKGQIAVNKEEAATGNLFIGGWRPFIGWTCGAAFAYKFVLAPAVAFTLNAYGNPVVLPVLDFTEMSSVLLGMLGLGAMRTVEKVKGVS